MTNSKYFIEVSEEMYGCTGTHKIFMPLPKCEIDMEKALKKWYNRLYRKLPKGMDSIQYYAMVEREDGSYDDLSMTWNYQTWENDPEAYL